MDSKLKNALIAKYSFMFLLILNMLSSIWIIIYDLNVMKKVQEEYPDDWKYNEKHEGHYVIYWFIACVIIMILNLLISLVGLYGAKIESSHITIIVSALFSVIAVYGAWDKYMKGSITSFLIPLFVSIVGTLFASLNFLRIYEENSNIPGAARIKYISKKPTTPTTLVGILEEAKPFNEA